MNIALDEQVLAKILGVAIEGTKSLKDKSGSVKFLEVCGKLDDLNIKNLTKKSLKEEFQLLFELVNRVLLPRTEKQTNVAGPDLFLMEALSKFKHVNLHAVIIEHIHKVMTTKDGKRGLAYGFWFNGVFLYFDVKYRPGKDRSMK